MSKELNKQRSESLNQKAIKRLLKNKPAVLGMVWIILSVLIAILGYLITPDSTPNTNEQIVEVALQPPGFSIDMLAVRKNRTFEQQNIFKTMLVGKPNEYKYIPINSHQFLEDSIFIERFMGIDNETGERYRGKYESYHIADVIFPLSLDDQTIEKRGEQFVFKDIENRDKTAVSTTLKNTIENKQLFTKTYYLGTDVYGRSMISRLILGVRISLLVGLIAVIISLTVGIFLGAIAGFFGGKVDDIIMLLINTVWSIPTLLLVFAIVLALGRSISIIFLAVGLTMWVDVARIVRGQVMSLKEIQYVEAAQSLGFTTWRIISKHILPNILGPVMVVAAANFAMAILIEAGLSYLGFGIQPPQPSWGTMLNENYGYAISGKPFLALIPAVAIMLMVLAFNLVGNGFRDAIDVKTNG